MATVYGKNYERTKDLGRVELKKEIQATIKKELAPGGELYRLLTERSHYLPPARPFTPAEVKAIKVTLKETGGRTCSSTHATIRGFKGVLNPERVAYDYGGPKMLFNPVRAVDREIPRYLPRASAFKNAIDVLIHSFNFDGSDIQTDYFHVRFYLDVAFDHEDEEAEREAIVCKASPLRAERIGIFKTEGAMVADYLAENGKKPLTWLDQNGAMSPGFLKAHQEAFHMAPEHTRRIVARLAEISRQLAEKDDWNDGFGWGSSEEGEAAHG